jgi:hypothetical protein
MNHLFAHTPECGIQSIKGVSATLGAPVRAANMMYIRSTQINAATTAISTKGLVFRTISLGRIATGSVSASPHTTATSAPSLTARTRVTIMAIAWMPIYAVATLVTRGLSVMLIVGVQGMGYAQLGQPQRPPHASVIWDGCGPRLKTSAFLPVLTLPPPRRALALELLPHVPPTANTALVFMAHVSAMREWKDETAQR